MSIITYFIEWNNVVESFIKYENLSIFIIIIVYYFIPSPKILALALHPGQTKVIYLLQ